MNAGPAVSSGAPSGQPGSPAPARPIGSRGPVGQMGPSGQLGSIGLPGITAYLLLLTNVTGILCLCQYSNLL